MTTTSTAVSAVSFRLATADDIDRCLTIEEASYPSDEAATLSSLRYRQEEAGDYFLCAVLDDTVIGFVCATRCQAFTHETMSKHDPKGKLLAIHSVVIEETHRRKGIASTMLKEYCARIDSLGTKPNTKAIETIVLMAKSNLLGFYVKAGFSVLRPSDIVHGKELWYHLERSVGTTPSTKKESGMPCWVVDSFATKAGEGNPAGVVLLTEPCEDIEWMKTVAIEFNLSETAFVWPMPDSDKSKDDKNNRYAIRYYTGGGSEVDLCGHATLASAAALLNLPDFLVNKVIFEAKKDTLEASRAVQDTGDDETSDGTEDPYKTLISMEFPNKQQTPVADELFARVVSMLQAAFPLSADAISSSVSYIGIDEDGGDLLIHMDTNVFVGLQMDGVNFDAIASLEGYSRGIMICADSDKDGIDFLSRFFGPKVGIDEDPVTGSAHCVLAPYFSTKLNKSRVVGNQTSKRGGIVQCTVHEKTVSIVGPAVVTLQGTTRIPMS